MFDYESAEDELLETLIAIQRARAVRPPASLVSRVPPAILRFREALTAETDRGCALHAAEYLNHELGQLLRAHFVDDQKTVNAVLEGRGALSTFSARIDQAYLLGLLTASAKRDLDLIRRIRNDFAHTADHIRFSSASIASRCNELTFHHGAEEPRRQFLSSTMAVLAHIHSRAVAPCRPTVPADVDAAAWRKLVEQHLVESNED